METEKTKKSLQHSDPNQGKNKNLPDPSQREAKDLPNPNQNQKKEKPKKDPYPPIIAHFFEKVNTSRAKPFLIILALLCWTTFSVFASQLIFYIFFRLLFNDFTTSAVLSTLYEALSYLSSLFLTVFVPTKLLKKPRATREDLGLNNLPTFIDLGLAPIGFCIYFLLANLLTTIFSFFPWFNVEEAQNVGFEYLSSGLDYFVAFVSLVIIAPIAEEIIFRGWLYGKLRKTLPKKFSLPLSILLVSALFGFLHGQWNVGVNVFAMSVVLCSLREITGTIYSGIFLHILKNAVAFYLVFVLGLS